MKNLKNVARASKKASSKHSIPIYYNIFTEEVLTEEMVLERGLENLFKCTELIRECTEKEIESYVWRSLWM